jgi:hypothetical protein
MSKENGEIISSANAWIASRLNNTPMLVTTGSMVYPTDEVMSSSLAVNDDPEVVLERAMEFIKEETGKKVWVFDQCSCHYCFSKYEANLFLGYQCPGCGAREYTIIGSMERSME